MTNLLNNITQSRQTLPSDATSNAYVSSVDDSKATNTYVNSTFTTESYVDAEVAGIVNSAPATLDTLNELAAALGDDPNFATTVTNTLATKASNTYVNTTFSSNTYLQNAGFASNTYLQTQLGGGSVIIIGIGDSLFDNSFPEGHNTYTTTQSVAVPADATKAYILAVGAGGAGGSAEGQDTGGSRFGGAGGAGGVAITVIEDIDTHTTPTTALYVDITSGTATVRQNTSGGTILCQGGPGGAGQDVVSTGSVTGTQGTQGSHTGYHITGAGLTLGTGTGDNEHFNQLPIIKYVGLGTYNQVSGANIRAGNGTTSDVTGKQGLPFFIPLEGWEDTTHGPTYDVTSTYGSLTTRSKNWIDYAYQLINGSVDAGDATAQPSTAYGAPGLPGYNEDTVSVENGAAGGPAAVMIGFFS